MRLPQVGEIWVHYKKGTYYRIVMIATNESDLKIHVLYREEFDLKSRIWSRSIDDFLAPVPGASARFTPAPRKGA